MRHLSCSFHLFSKWLCAAGAWSFTRQTISFYTRVMCSATSAAYWANQRRQGRKITRKMYRFVMSCSVSVCLVKSVAYWVNQRRQGKKTTQKMCRFVMLCRVSSCLVASAVYWANRRKQGRKITQTMYRFVMSCRDSSCLVKSAAYWVNRRKRGRKTTQKMYRFVWCICILFKDWNTLFVSPAKHSDTLGSLCPLSVFVCIGKWKDTGWHVWNFEKGFTRFTRDQCPFISQCKQK